MIKKALYILIFLFSFNLSGQLDGNPDVTVATWKANFDAEMTRENSDFLNHTSSSPNISQPRYYDMRFLDPLIYMVMATGDLDYVDDFVFWLDRIKGLATQSGDGYFDWPENGTNFHLYESHGMRNVFKMLLLADLHPAIMARLTSAKYTEYKNFFTANVWDKWVARESIFRSATHMSSHLASNMALYLHLIETNPTKADEYISWVNSFNDDSHANQTKYGVSGIGFRDQLRIQDNAYTWSYSWGNTSNHTDSGHSNGEVQAVINQYRHGVGNWDSNDLDLFDERLNLILASATQSDYADIEYVFYSGQTNSSRAYINYGWAMLGAFYPATQEKLENFSVSRHQNGHYYANFCGVMALNRAYLDGTVVYDEVQSAVADTTAPTMANVTVEDVADDHFRVYFNPYDATKVANEFATAQGRIGTSSGVYTQTGDLTGFYDYHGYRFGVNGTTLFPATTYYYQMQLVDQSGNGTGIWLPELTHTTLGSPPPSLAVRFGNNVELNGNRAGLFLGTVKLN